LQCARIRAGGCLSQVLQCVAVCVAVCCSVCCSACCSVLELEQEAAFLRCCSVLQCVLQCVAVFCSILQCVAVYVAVCCSVCCSVRCSRRLPCSLLECLSCIRSRGGGMGSSTIFKNLMSPTPRRNPKP